MTRIKCNNLSKTYKEGKHLALDCLNLDVGENSVFGFLGPNGAGKTTTIKILTGLMQPSSGEAFVANEKVIRNSISLRQKIGYLGQEPAMYKWMKGKELLLFVGKIFGLKNPENNKRADMLLEISGLSDAANRKIATYSGGMVQRLGIAQALVSKPLVLFLDEPTSSLDPIGRKEVLEFIANLKNETTVFMSTHILSDVERICDHVGILNKGKLLACDKLDMLKTKFSKNVCEIEFEKPEKIQDFVSILIQWGLLKYKVNGDVLSIVLENNENDKAKILSRIIDNQIEVNRIEFTHASLEDIFVELVNKSE